MNTINSLPMYFPPDFNLDTARYAALLTDYAYDMYTQWQDQHKPRRQDQFNWTPPTGTNLIFSRPVWSSYKLFDFFNASEPFGFVAMDKADNGYLVFRGTSSDADWIDDIDEDQHDYELVPGYGKVHDGFYKLYESMRTDVFGLLGDTQFNGMQNLTVTGHSLGCGLSTLAVPDILNNIEQLHFSTIRHYNLASPRVGDPAFTNAYNGNGVLTFRVVNTCDVVPTVPLAALGELYKHVGTPVDFTAQYGSIGGNHSLKDAYCYALDHPDSPENSEQANL